MSRWSRFVFPLCAAPLLGSCYFLLDYSDLQSDTGQTAASGGASEGGSSALTPGGETSAGGDACLCDDGDPCTTDTCETGSCRHEPLEGLKLDGFDETLKAEQHVRASLVGSGQLFYLAELELNDGAPSVSLFRLATDGAELEEIGTDLRLDGNPISNVGLAVEELAAGEVALHGFVATKLKVGDGAPHVVHVVNRGGKSMSNIVGLSYRADITTAFPQALSIGGKVVGAWIQADGTIAVHNVGTAKTDNFGLATLPATSLSLLSTSDEQPAVMFTAQNDTGALGTYVETSGQNRAKVPECETRPGSYLSSSVISTQIPGLWLADITRAGTGYLTTGSASLVCANNTCTAVPEDCKKAMPGNALREVTGATIHFDNDKAGLVYSVAALPQIAPKANDAATIEARLLLTLGRVDFSGDLKDAQSSAVGDTQVVAANDTTEAQAFAGPDWPAVAILPSQRVAVAWIQPNRDFSGTELRVQRYKMCLPPP